MSIDNLAMKAGMSKFHFAKSFCHGIGSSPHQYVVQAQIQKAKMLLEDDLSIPQIASRVGYADRGQFSAQFLRI
jgi:AraC family transcriptional regulator